jgi:hypothetical protein
VVFRAQAAGETAYYAKQIPIAPDGFGLGPKPDRRREKSRKTRETAETTYDLLETSMLGNPIDENSL